MLAVGCNKADGIMFLGVDLITNLLVTTSRIKWSMPVSYTNPKRLILLKSIIAELKDLAQVHVLQSIC